jgi:hypothetical protein
MTSDPDDGTDTADIAQEDLILSRRDSFTSCIGVKKK